MSRFRTSALRVLERLYGFVAGQPLGEVELDLPIQLVHNVSREIEVSSGYGITPSGGYWLIGPTHTHAAADSQRSVTNPYTVVRANAAINATLPPSNLDIDIWYMGWSGMFETGGLITAANSGIWFPPIPGQTAAFPMLVWAAAGAYAMTDLAGTGNAQVNSAAAAGYRPNGPLLPTPLPVGSLLGHLSTSSAATTVVIADLCWLGPKGCLPPGVA